MYGAQMAFYDNKPNMGVVDGTQDAPYCATSLRIGDTVPRFIARSTQGDFDLATHRGHWVILFSHPADFTPVCTSEMVALGRSADAFAALDCQLVGLSVDSLYAHLAWLRLIRDTSGVQIDFPIIEDPDMEVSRAFGMVFAHARDSGAVRVTYFIDPDGVLQASTAYPLTVGRSIPEMLRMLTALQRVRSRNVLAPADWEPGADLLQVAGTTADAAFNARKPEDWFFATCPDEG